MKAFYTAILTLGLITTTSTYAQNFDDSQLKANLADKSGFVALELGGEITEDNMQRDNVTSIMIKDVVIEGKKSVPITVIENQPVVKSKTVIGNTDTGVTVEEMKMAVEKEMK